MITFLTFAPSFGQAAASPFCVKALILLHMADQPYTRVDVADPRKMPYGKLPAIRVKDAVIADSDNIRAWLEAQGADFDAGLNPEQRAYSRALIRMAEEHIYFYTVLDRWGDDAVWPTVRDAYFGMIPRPLRGFVTNGLRKKLMAGMQAQGLGRFTPAERLSRIEHDLQAITTLVGDGFLFGDTPTAADASVGAMLAGIAATPIATLVGDRIRGDAVLMRYANACAALAISANA